MTDDKEVKIKNRLECELRARAATVRAQRAEIAAMNEHIKSLNQQAKQQEEQHAKLWQELLIFDGMSVWQFIKFKWGKKR